MQHVFELDARAPDVAGIDTIAVNLSGQSIGDRAFHRFAIGALAGPAPGLGRLCFEITETAAITNLTDAGRFMGSCARWACASRSTTSARAPPLRLSQELAADYLKIDGQFVRTSCATARPGGGALLLRHRALGRDQTIAECVETEAAADLLRGLGVDFLQGYLFHRPQPLDRATASRQDAGQQHSG